MTIFSKQLTRGSSTLALALGLMLPQTVQAQVSDSSRAAALEDIVVTARKRAEQVQNVPISITTLTGAALDERNFTSITNLAAVAPNLNINNSSGSVSGATISLRGISDNNSTVLTNDQPIGLYLDGVYLGRAAGAVFDIIDLERVEVLRGPQGTLFGRNTTGGAISLTTMRPGETAGFQQKLSYGSYNEWSSRTRIDIGEIGSSGIMARFAYAHRQRNGHFDNILTPSRRDPGALNTDTLFGAIHGDWERVRWDVRADFQDRQGSPNASLAIAASPLLQAYYSNSPNLGGSPFNIYEKRQKEGALDHRDLSTARIWGVSNTLEFDFSDSLTLKSISAYRKMKIHEHGDLSGNTGLRGLVLDPMTGAVTVDDVSPFQSENWSTQSQVSQEFQLLGETDRLNYVVGLYYFKEKVFQSNPQSYTYVIDTPAMPLGIQQQRTVHYNGTAQSYAAFAQASYNPAILDDKLELTLGARYTEDKRTLDQQDYSFGSPIPPSRALSRKWTNFSADGSLLYRFNEDVNFYARVASGYKAGGFSPPDLIGEGYNPEKVMAYEMGLKTEWFDRRLRVNVNGFYTVYKDRQVIVLTTSPTGGASNTTQNAGKAKYKGVELEIMAVPAAGLTLEGALGYTSPKYTEYKFVPAAGAAPINVADEAVFSYQAKFTAYAAIQYQFPEMAIGIPGVRISYSHISSRPFMPLPRVAPFASVTRDPGYDDVHARISLSKIPLGGALGEIAVYGENLLNDKEHRTGAIDFGALGFSEAQYGPPRTFGVSFSVDY